MSRQVPVLLAGVAAISCAAVLVRLAGAPPLFVAAGRLGIASAILLPLCLFLGRRELVDLVRRRWRAVLLAGSLLAAHFALWIASLSYTSVASSVVLVTTTPFIVAVGSYALTIVWEDGHDYGIFNWHYLRALCPCEEDRKKYVR